LSPDFHIFEKDIFTVIEADKI